jgi:protein phosphatase-4 regulatory subunit 3
LKDVVLARIIDDPTFSVLSSLIYYYQIDIVGHIQSNSAFLAELFSIFHSDASMQRKKDAVLFIQSCCVVSKQLQPAMKNNLFTNFLSNGLFGVIIFALRHPDPAVRVAGIDILIILIEHDAVLVRAHLFKSITDKTKPLTDTLIELLLIEVDLGVKSQEADAIKVLLDPMQNLACVEALNRTNNESLKNLRNGVLSAPQQEQIITDFFVASCRKLFKPLRDLVNRESSMYLLYKSCQEHQLTMTSARFTSTRGHALCPLSRDTLIFCPTTYIQEQEFHG